MKKTLLLVLTLVLGLGLVACKKDEEIKKSKPVLKGVESVEIMVGEAFDPKAGVTAIDEIDGDLTSKIKIEGTVNVDKAGTYELTYSVENSQKEKDMKRRVVFVKGLGGLANGDFSDGFTGWTQWFDTSKTYEVAYSVVEGKAVIDIKSDKTDNQWWAVQLAYKAISLEKFESYKLIFTVSAENERYMNYQIRGGGLSTQAFGEKNLIKLTPEPQTIEKEFFVKDDAEGAELQFAFGNFTKGMFGPEVNEEIGAVDGKVFLSNIKIVAGPELENQAPTLKANPVLLKVGTEQFLPKQGVEFGDDRDKLTINDVTVEDITEGTKFALPAVKGIYKFKYTLTDSEGLKTEITRTVQVALPFELPGFTEVGQNGVPLGWEVWGEANRGGITAATADGVVSLTLTNIGDKDGKGGVWENQFKYTKLAAFAGKYTLTFEAKADIARPVRVGIEGNGGVGIANIHKNFDLTTEWVTYTFVMDEILIDATTANRSVQFWFGSFEKVEGYSIADNILTTVHIRNVAVNPTA